jgi:3-phenylpropionate/trans-cinnamate dioxygenase ferredoxin subunit
VCPQHTSRYDVRTGTCLDGAQGDGFSQDLMTFKVEVAENVVRVEF